MTERNYQEDDSMIERLNEECPTCGTVHTAGSLRFDRQRDIRCIFCIDNRAPYCGRCAHQWTGLDNPNEALNECPACGSPTSMLPVRRIQ